MTYSIRARGRVERDRSKSSKWEPRPEGMRHPDRNWADNDGACYNCKFLSKPEGRHWNDDCPHKAEAAAARKVKFDASKAVASLTDKPSGKANLARGTPSQEPADQCPASDEAASDLTFVPGVPSLLDLGTIDDPKVLLSASTATGRGLLALVQAEPDDSLSSHDSSKESEHSEDKEEAHITSPDYTDDEDVEPPQAPAPPLATPAPVPVAAAPPPPAPPPAPPPPSWPLPGLTSPEFPTRAQLRTSLHTVYHGTLDRLGPDGGKSPPPGSTKRASDRLVDPSTNTEIARGTIGKHAQYILICSGPDSYLSLIHI